MDDSSELRCDGPKCGKKAALRPQLTIREYVGGPPLRAVLSISLCEECAKKDQIDNYTDHEKWNRMCSLIGVRFGDKPRKELCELKHIPLWKTR